MEKQEVISNEELIAKLKDKYECFILIGQQVEFEETILSMKAYSMAIYCMLKDAFEKYPPLKDIAESVLKDMNEPPSSDKNKVK